jgi:serine/threonine protein kinase
MICATTARLRSRSCGPRSRPSSAERFLKEIETTANLQHPNILPLFDSGRIDGTVFYVMPYLAGESLRERLRRDTQPPVVDAIRIVGVTSR